MLYTLFKFTHSWTYFSSNPCRHSFATLSFVAEIFIFLYVGMDALDIEKWKFVSDRYSLDPSIIIYSLICTHEKLLNGILSCTQKVCFSTKTVLVLLDVTRELFSSVFSFYFSLVNFYSAFINLLNVSFLLY